MDEPPVLLIVEDEPLAQFLAGSISAMRYRPFVVTTVAAALRQLASRPFSVIVADYIGTVEGLFRPWPIAQLLARIAPGTPVLALTATGDVPKGTRVDGIVRLPEYLRDLEKGLRLHSLDRPLLAADPLLAKYLAALWDADQREAARAIAEAAAAGWTALRIYEELLTAALHEIGGWWEARSCTVADEHGARAITERLMAEISSGVPVPAARGELVTVACLPAERHDLGARMVADVLSWNGWSVRFLGADVPAGDLIEDARRRRPHAIALSATLRPDLDSIRALIAGLRRAASPAIVLGGQAFRRLGRQASERLGADGLADRAAGILDLLDKRRGAGSAE